MPSELRRRRSALLAVTLVAPFALVAVIVPSGSSGAAPAVSPVAARVAKPAAHHSLKITTLSVRADLVAGGEVLTRIVPATGHYSTHVHVTLNGHNVSPEFAKRADQHIEGLLHPLRIGRNKVVATVRGERAVLTVTDHPRGGPDFSGPQIKPWKCEGGATDVKCDHKRTVQYFYLPVGTDALSLGVSGVTAVSAFQSYDPKHPPPAAVIANTKTLTGVGVPFIVREETGYLDRDQYAIATLWQPGKPWKPWAPQHQFNHRLVITHGASCDTSYAAGSAPTVMDPKLLAGGFVLMSNALDNAGHNCNLITEAESLVMTKQYTIDHYGPVKFTIGTGCSGGSLVQQQVANAYPGIYQGITPQCSFTDAWSSAMEYVDYSILLKYFEAPTQWGSGVAWTPTGIQQVIDHPNIGNPVTFTTVIPNSADPSRSCPGVPAAKVYQPKTNPRGVKCTLQDYMVNVFGKAKDGFANRPFGNDGIQYGLAGLINGEISAKDFVDLNVKVGGLTKNDTHQAKRSLPSRIALKRAYRSGAVNTATNMNKVAIIDLRGPDPGFFHDVYRTYAMRARLLQDFGTAANQVLWRGQAPIIGDVNYSDQAVYAMNGWLNAVHADHRHLALAAKIIQDKPVDLTDRCTDGAGTALPSYVCDATVEAYGTPRIAAGMPATDDILECHKQPLRKSSYPVTFTAAQWSALKRVFPHGVCNYNEPSVGQHKAIAWQTYQKPDGRVIYGGRPMGPPPTSRLVKR